MPIVIKDFDWTESLKKIIITLPRKKVKTSSVDVLVTPLYLKVNFNPYFFELHLHYEIEDSAARTVLEGENITIHLDKRVEAIWEVIGNPEARDAATRRDLVRNAIEYHENKVKAEVEERAKVKAEQNRQALRTAMDQDSRERERIESVKQAERDKVTDEMNEWQLLDDGERERKYLQSIKPPSGAGEDLVLDTPPDESSDNLDEITYQIQVDKERARKFEKIKHNLANPLKPKVLEETKSDQKPMFWESDGPRKSSEISVSFTKRYFPSAARESLQAEEDAWIEKNVRAQSVIKPADGDTKDEERNPMWLSDKAGVFYKQGNFPAAINAYSEAINISPDLPKLYINRASCYIVLNLFEDAVIDCTRAIDLLTPPVEGNRMSRVRTLAKRGSAYCQLGSFREALADYRLAQKLAPEDQKLSEDVQLLETKLNISTPNSNTSTAPVAT